MKYKDFYEHLFPLNEALSLKNVRKYKTSRKNSGAYSKEFLNSIFKEKDRLILNFDFDLSTETHNLFRVIKNTINDAQYDFKSPEDYIQNICYRIKDGKLNKNQTSVGRVLTSLNRNGLLKQFVEDPIRKQDVAKESEFKVVISRHPYDLYGMSTDRDWSSCMQLAQSAVGEYKKSSSDGINKHYIASDVKYGTLVSYLVSSSDIDKTTGKIKIKRPLSRILMKPFESGNKIAYGIGKLYGNKYKDFLDFVTKWVKDNLNENINPEDEYVLQKGLYNDQDTVVGAKTTSGTRKLIDRVLDTDFYFDETHNKHRQMFDIDFINGHGNSDYGEFKIRFNIDSIKEIDHAKYLMYNSNALDLGYSEIPESILNLMGTNPQMGIRFNSGEIELIDTSQSGHDEERNGKNWNNDMEMDYISEHLSGIRLLKMFEKHGYEKIRSLVEQSIPVIYERIKKEHQTRLEKIEAAKSKADKILDTIDLNAFKNQFKKLENEDVSLYLFTNVILLEKVKKDMDFKSYVRDVCDYILEKYNKKFIEELIEFLKLFDKMTNIDYFSSIILDKNNIGNIPSTAIHELLSKFVKKVDKELELGIESTFKKGLGYSPILTMSKIKPILTLSKIKLEYPDELLLNLHAVVLMRNIYINKILEIKNSK